MPDKRIWMVESTYNNWFRKKHEHGFGRQSNSQFAGFLLRQLGDLIVESETDEEITMVESGDTNSDVDVDVTGNASSNTSFQSFSQNNESIIMEPSKNSLSSANNVSLNLTPNIGIQGPETIHLESTPSENKDCANINKQHVKQCLEFQDLDETMSASENPDMLTPSERSESSDDEETDTASEDSDDVLDSDIDDLEGYMLAKDDLSDVGMDDTQAIDFTIIPETVIAPENLPCEEEEKKLNQTTYTNVNMSISMNGSLDFNPNLIEAPLEGNLHHIREKVTSGFGELCTTEDDETSDVDKERVIVSLEKLVQLRGEICGQPFNNGFCTEKVTSVWMKGYGGTSKSLKWTCPNKHYGKWESSEVIAIRDKRPIYLNDLLLSSALVLTGNNWAKCEALFKALNVNVIGRNAFHRMQNLFISPEIREFWDSMHGSIIKILGDYQGICLSGDGRSDSPGHCARYCTYVIMDHMLKIVVDLTVLDCRETEGISTRMEKEGLVRLLKKLKDKLKISEITTDASSSVIKAVRELKEKYPNLANLFHSLDTWHKAKALRKALTAAAKTKEGESLTEWVEPIVNHFWHCSQNCNTNLVKLKDMWLGVVHHICGEHVWATGECSHGELEKDEEEKTPLAKDSKAMELVRKIVLDHTFVDNLKFYTRFRHTGAVENFNSMMLKYAPKRNAFEFQYYTDRMFLAAIDHNLHLFCTNLTTSTGRQIYARKYNKRTKRWHIQPLKAPKSHPHIRKILTKIIQRRKAHTRPLAPRATKLPNDPKLISPTIGGRPPSTKILKIEHVSRLPNS